MQTRVGSAIEAVCNIGSGAIIAFCTMQFVLSPLLGIEISLGQNGWVTVALTIVSVTRSYLWRRYFNKRIMNRVNELRKGGK